MLNTNNLKFSVLFLRGLFCGIIIFFGMILIDAFVNSLPDNFVRVLAGNLYLAITLRRILISCIGGLILAVFVHNYKKR
jgi:hypothetical protein